MSGKFALIIANTEYTDPKLAELSAPVKDAEDFALILKDKAICAFDDVKVLLNQQYHIIRETIDEFFDQKKPDDLLVLYFSGHGVRDEFGTLYLTAENTNRARLRSTAIKSDFVHDAMDQSRSKRQVLILDCCNSGAFPQGTKAEIGGTMGMANAFQGYGRFVLTASDSTQFAWEGDKVIGETDNSLFTHFLVEGLKGEADRDGDGQITVDELYDYAYENVKLATPKQTPSKFSSKQQGEIILRQNIRIEDTKPIPLPDELIEAINSSLPFVREGAVRQLEALLSGRNLGLARSARLALEKVAEEDDSRSISQTAADILERIQTKEELAENMAEDERLARDQAEREAAEKAAREKADREAILAKVFEEAYKEKAEREAAEKAEQEAIIAKAYEEAYEEKANREKTEREAVLAKAYEKAYKEKTEREAAGKASREKADREIAEKATQEKAESKPTETVAAAREFGEDKKSEIISERPQKPSSLPEKIKSSRPTLLPEAIKPRGKPKDLPK